MRHSLHAHIIYLENSIRDVTSRLTQPGLKPEEVEDLQLQLTLAESALEHYRKAYTLELSLAGSEPPNNPAGNGSESGGEGAQQSKGPEKKDGLASIEAAVRKGAARTGRFRASQQGAFGRGRDRRRGLACA